MNGAPDPESMSLLAKVLAAATAVIVPIWGVRTWLEKRFDKKADKHWVANQFQSVADELAHQRETQAKLFDQVRENEQRAQDRHERLLDAVHSKGNS